MEENIDPSVISDKYVFLDPDELKFNSLKQYLGKQIEIGQGECFLELGVGDGQDPGLNTQEMEQSVSTANRLAKQLNANLIFLRDRHITNSGRLTNSLNSSAESELTFKLSDASINTNKKSSKSKLSESNIDETVVTTVSSTTSSQSHQPVLSSSSVITGSLVKEFLLRSVISIDDFVDVRVAVVGNVDAGKSTLLGVLTHGELDNGRGLARLRLLRHKHEAETGRTSSVGNDILGFNSAGNVVNKPVHGNLNWCEICEASAKVITFIDLAGHERYLKTTIFGMTGHAPDYVMFIVGANSGMIGMAKEHLGLALALCVPVFVVVTKIDMCPENVLNDTMNLLNRILKSPGCRKIPALISSKDDVICCATNFTSERMCPIFAISNVDGTNLDLLKLFLNLLPPRSRPRLNDSVHFQIDEIFSVQGVGTVISGTCLAGLIHINDTLLLGPDSSGQFNLVTIKSIQRKRLPVNYVHGGQSASFAMKKLRRSQVRKGMVLLSCDQKPTGCIEFIAEVLILHHPTTIGVGYQAMVHAGPIRQTATITKMFTHERLRTGDKDRVLFRFIKNPEYLYSGLRLIFREGKTKAVGTVKEVVPYVTPVPSASRNRFIRKYQPANLQRTENSNPVPITQIDEINNQSISNMNNQTDKLINSNNAELPNKSVTELLSLNKSINSNNYSRPKSRRHYRGHKNFNENNRRNYSTTPTATNTTAVNIGSSSSSSGGGGNNSNSNKTSMINISSTNNSAKSNHTST